jgi:hypothetical protein
MRIAHGLEPRVAAESDTEILVNLALKQLKVKVFGGERLKNGRGLNRCRSNVDNVRGIVGKAANETDFAVHRHAVVGDAMRIGRGCQLIVYQAVKIVIRQNGNLAEPYALIVFYANKIHIIRKL